MTASGLEHGQISRRGARLTVQFRTGSNKYPIRLTVPKTGPTSTAGLATHTAAPTRQCPSARRDILMPSCRESAFAWVTSGAA